MNEIDIMLTFLEQIGLEYFLQPIEEETFLPGLKMHNGALIIDIDKLTYPGDILHEAGHLACMPPEMRKTMSGTLENNNMHQGGELMAIAWSYAACSHLKFDPKIVFHEHGYKNAAGNIIEYFEQGYNIGVPLLQWRGLCYDIVTAKEMNSKPFPEMQSWICESVNNSA